MPRRKSYKKTSLKPASLKFGALDSEAPSDIVLSMSRNELEALYLMDYHQKYQQECADIIGISRSTFSKLIRQARKKSAEMLVRGINIQISDDERAFVLAYATNDRISLADNVILAKLFGFATIDQNSITSISYILNPIVKELEEKNIDFTDEHDGSGLKAGLILPPLFEKAQIFMTKSIGDGLKRNLEGLGVRVTTGQFETLDDALRFELNS